MNDQLHQTLTQKYRGATRDALIPALQEIQEAEGYLSRAAVIHVSEMIDLPVSKIYGVASFYNQFRFEPVGRYLVQVCRGTACHVKGSAEVLQALKQELGVSESGTTADGLFTLDVVACIGACGLAPVITINGEFHAKLTPEAVVDIIQDIRAKEADHDE